MKNPLARSQDPAVYLVPGGPDQTREVVKLALKHGAAAVVLSHNHPSGGCTPSRADEVLTNTLKTALALVDVRVLDHIIVSATETLSMAERGLM